MTRQRADNANLLDGEMCKRHEFARMLIFKIFRQSEWQDLKSQGQTKGAPIDLQDGFVHFSTSAQVAETCARYFADVPDLFLVAVQSDDLGADLKWEPSRGGDLFPHLYRELRMSDVIWQVALPLGPAGHEFPAGVL